MRSSISSVLTTWVLLAQCLSAQSTEVNSAASRTSSLTSSTLTSSFRSVSSLGSSVSRNVTASSSSFYLRSSTTEDVTAIAGVPTSTVRNSGTVSGTTSSQPRPSNTRPCNGYPEFCNRKFSNITMVVAHNSPFVKEHNAASNQVLPVLTQLNDGIRGLSFETQKPNGSSDIMLCHTSCDLLNVGTLQSYLSTVVTWLDAHPYEVVALLMGNNNGHDDRIPPSEFASTFDAAGITEYMYTPPSTSMNITEWPTLGEMIIKNKRVVAFLDYGTNQEEVPWLLSEWGYQWETPFSPTDPAFPCTQQRPPNQAEDVSRERMYVMNHNLNIDIDIGGTDILVPAYSLLDQVNAVSGNGSLGLNVQNCEKMWGRPPNWLLIDYHNFGNFNGSAFQVAATANDVSYNRDSCCRSQAQSAASGRSQYILSVLLGCAAVVSLIWGRGNSLSFAQFLRGMSS